MKLSERVSFHFVEIRGVGLAAVFVFVMALGYVSLSSLSVPSGDYTIHNGVVESVGLTQDSALQLAHSTALVKLSSGQYATVHVPRAESIAKGQRVKIREIHQTTGNSFSIVVGESNAQ